MKLNFLREQEEGVKVTVSLARDCWTDSIEEVEEKWRLNRLKVVAAYTGNNKGFGDYLRKMKSRLTKDSKLFEGGEGNGNNIHN